MKRSLFLLFILLGFAGNAQRTCGTAEKVAALKAADPAFAAHYEVVRERIQNPNMRQNRASEANAPAEIITIPVVFHILYKNATQNISDAQINSQLAVLNADYRKLNTDFSSVVPAAFQPMAADMEIVFVKAAFDEWGEPTTGVTRKQVPSSFNFDDNYYTNSGQPAWNPDLYLNIWVGRFTDGGLLGFAWPPAAAGAPFDGLCIGDQFFGTTGTAMAPFNKGRTATHEIGHYFGLEHLWGDSPIDDDATPTSCNTSANSDGVADTPPQWNAHYNCPNFPRTTYTCSTSPNGAMFMNFMDYTNDACMAFFTNGQKNIVHNTISSERASLLFSPGLSVENVSAIRAISVHPNPASTYFTITSPNHSVDYVEVYNTTGQLVKSQAIDEVHSKVSIEEMETGIYYLRIYNDKMYLKSAKIIKN